MEPQAYPCKYYRFCERQNNSLVAIKERSGVRKILRLQDFTSFSQAGPHSPEVLSRGQRKFIIRNEDKLSRHLQIYDRGQFLYFSIAKGP
jgi:hypothetical protein